MIDKRLQIELHREVEELLENIDDLFFRMEPASKKRLQVESNNSIIRLVTNNFLGGAVL